MQVKDYSENYGTGYWFFWRSLIKHHLVGFKKPFRKSEAWIWLLDQAQFKNTKDYRNFGDKERLIDMPRGTVTHSLRFMATAWGWSTNKVKRFLNQLENESMLTQKRIQQITQLTICNYDDYQGSRIQQRIQQKNSSETAEKQQKNEIKKEKKVKKEKNIKYNGKINPKILYEIYREENKYLPDVIAFTDKRKEKCRLRLNHFYDDSDNYLKKFREAIQKTQLTPFLIGKNNTGWRASFDWFIENDENMLKVIEGKYDA